MASHMSRCIRIRHWSVLFRTSWHDTVCHMSRIHQEGRLQFVIHEARHAAQQHISMKQWLGYKNKWGKKEEGEEKSGNSSGAITV